MRHKAITAAAPLPIASDKPLIDKTELQRSIDSLVRKQMTAEERERYGPAVPRGQKPFTMPQRRPGA